MSDDRSTFETTRARLEDIVVQVRRKDVSLEQSLDMLEEAVRLVNQCNELIDQTSFRAPAPVEGDETVAGDEAVAEPAPAAAVPEGTEAAADSADAADADAAVDADEGDDASVESVAVVETFELIDIDGDDIEFFEVDVVEGAGQTPEIEDDERS